jgi:hypothetical protein
LGALEHGAAITTVALNEVRAGRRTGRTTWPILEGLVGSGQIEELSLTDHDEASFYELVAGLGADTLDDGEAATIVCACRIGGTAVIDERKATRLARSRWASLPIVSASDVLLSERLVGRLGVPFVSGAVYAALTGANMFIPERLLPEIVDLLTVEQLANCRSLPMRVRAMRRTAA